jgi:fatty acid desaturase
MDTDRVVRAAVRAELAPEVFARRPWRCLLMLPLVAVDVSLSLLLVRVWLPWYFAVPLALLLGNLRASTLFFAHEVVHGATVHARWLQELLAYPACASFFFSPNTWRIWHNQSHHGHTNQPGKDPDNFGTLEEFRSCARRTRWFSKFAPGGGYWPSAIYLFAFFSIQAQNVIWAKSTRMPGYEQFSRARAALETALLVAFWCAVTIVAGPRGALLIVILPMAVGNAVILSYVLTNHMLRPLSAPDDTLTTTMSVRTLGLLDRVHFYFSHHVEHHLFPAVCSSRMPRIRRVLQERFGDRYLCPSHWHAVRMIFHTPRIYDGADALVDPYSARREEIPAVEAALRGG